MGWIHEIIPTCVFSASSQSESRLTGREFVSVQLLIHFSLRSALMFSLIVYIKPKARSGREREWEYLLGIGEETAGMEDIACLLSHGGIETLK